MIIERLNSILIYDDGEGMNKDIAEKDVKVEIDILEVRIPQKTVLDDNFAKSMGAVDLNDFKEKVTLKCF